MYTHLTDIMDRSTHEQTQHPTSWNLTHTHLHIHTTPQTTPSPPGRLHGHTAKPHTEGGEGLANVALDQVSLECQLHVPVKCQLQLHEDAFCTLGGIQVETQSSTMFARPFRPLHGASPRACLTGRLAARLTTHWIHICATALPWIPTYTHTHTHTQSQVPNIHTHTHTIPSSQHTQNEQYTCERFNAATPPLMNVLSIPYT